VVEQVGLTAPDGPAVADVHLSGGWPWLVLVLGIVVVAAGGLLL
jgi:hypothetical protein